jgi:hypothetical protein
LLTLTGPCASFRFHSGARLFFFVIRRLFTKHLKYL